jgi:hypothetical protein
MMPKSGNLILTAAMCGLLCPPGCCRAGSISFSELFLDRTNATEDPLFARFGSFNITGLHRGISAQASKEEEAVFPSDQPQPARANQLRPLNLPFDVIATTGELENAVFLPGAAGSTGMSLGATTQMPEALAVVMSSLSVSGEIGQVGPNGRRTDLGSLNLPDRCKNLGSSIPVPAGLVLLGISTLGLMGYRWRQGRSRPT